MVRLHGIYNVCCTLLTIYTSFFFSAQKKSSFVRPHKLSSRLHCCRDMSTRQYHLYCVHRNACTATIKSYHCRNLDERMLVKSFIHLTCVKLSCRRIDAASFSIFRIPSMDHGDTCVTRFRNGILCAAKLLCPAHDCDEKFAFLCCARVVYWCVCCTRT